jgi:hypothetical protein
MYKIKDDQEKPYMKRYKGYGIADIIHAYQSFKNSMFYLMTQGQSRNDLI